MGTARPARSPWHRTLDVQAFLPDSSFLAAIRLKPPCERSFFVTVFSFLCHQFDKRVTAFRDILVPETEERRVLL